jgi:polysaccharide pyruvyl transferase WcaK-like protein
LDQLEQAAMTIFEVSEAAAGGVHDYLRGEANALAQLLDRSRLALGAGPVRWSVPVTAATVHRIESLHRLADEEGIRIHFKPVSHLCDRDRHFFQDYAEHRLNWRPTRKIREVCSALRETGDALTRVLQPARRSPNRTKTLRSIVIIGAYGGDHIGDAAILGGVLYTLNRCYGVRHATVMSYRPHHTRQLVLGLSVPVTIAVEPYLADRVDHALDHADALFLAGGPLFDAPRVLTKHLASIHSARIRGRPFLVERVGISPTWWRPSRWLARRILESADSISVRSSGSAHHPLLSGLSPQIAHDPAFDYLETRRTLDKLGEVDKQAVDALTAGAEGSVLVGLNLRPTHDQHAGLGKIVPQALWPGLLDGLSAALIRFAADLDRPVRFIFFPMNAVQHGMSDMAAAFQLHRAAGSRIDLRVWEGNPGLEGVLYLMRKLDLVIAMRLHAAIFSMTQGLPVVGLDYFPGRGGKLTELFCDNGRSDWVRTVQNFEASWFVEMMKACINANSLKPPSRPSSASAQENEEAPMKKSLGKCTNRGCI